MELNHDKVMTPPRAAATVVLLRDSAQGPEIFLVKRHGQSEVLADAYVFPGGKVDAQDSDPASLCLFADQRDFVGLLGEAELSADQAAALVFAACRETFEECGVLLVEGLGSEPQARAQALLRDGRSFAEVLASMNLRLHSSAIQAWSRWITPIVPSLTQRRFDARFLIIRLPEGQIASHDNREASASTWLSPRAALNAFWAREIDLAPPQIMTLAHLSRFGTIAQILHESASRPPPVILPQPFEIDGRRVVAYPGDPKHPIAQRAMPGPTRLVFRGGRFEPFEGFEGFFA